MSNLHFIAENQSDIFFKRGSFLKRMMRDKSQYKEEENIESICWNLTKIFNTRQGSVCHLQDYGLPDLNTVYRNMPISINHFLISAEAVIEKYEPRLNHITVLVKKTHQPNQVLEVEIQGVINYVEEITLIGCFNSDGGVEVMR